MFQLDSTQCGRLFIPIRLCELVAVLDQILFFMIPVVLFFINVLGSPLAVMFSGFISDIRCHVLMFDSIFLMS